MKLKFENKPQAGDFVHCCLPKNGGYYHKPAFERNGGNDMTKYNEEFKLTAHDIELIDYALGEQHTLLSCGAALTGSGEASDYKVYKLNIRDIELIENAVRDRISALSQINLSPSVPVFKENDGRIRQFEELLGTLYNQKVWYSQVHHTGVPLG
jgi:hypothetical protein